jgi:hypothetical protein
VLVVETYLRACLCADKGPLLFRAVVAPLKRFPE